MDMIDLIRPLRMPLFFLLGILLNLIIFKKNTLLERSLYSSVLNLGFFEEILKYPDKLKVAFSSYRRDDSWWPSSFWMRKIK